MCRDHVKAWRATCPKGGSSLHVQGPLLSSSNSSTVLRIIPACAGTTIQFSFKYACAWDHPCMCRDHLIVPIDTVFDAGSSLHVQGPLSNISYFLWVSRIIPACAGTTSYDGVKTGTVKDHPCMCRNHTFCVSVATPTSGSSLHVQGPLH